MLHLCSFCSTIPLQYVHTILTSLKRNDQEVVKLHNYIQQGYSLSFIYMSWLITYGYIYITSMLCSHMLWLTLNRPFTCVMYEANVGFAYLNGFQPYKWWCIEQAINQASKKTDITVDLLCWGSLRLSPTRVTGESLSESHHIRSTMKFAFLLAWMIHHHLKAINYKPNKLSTYVKHTNEP